MKFNPIRNRAYKVVCPIEHRLLSFAQVHLPNEIVIHYREDGSLIRPSIGKIFIFLDIDDACAFHVGSKGQIWEVEAYGIEKKFSRLYVHTQHNPKLYNMFWSNNLTCLHQEMAGAPVGTYVCSSLRMKKRILS
jgi:hypothetical protein